jgi:hypothetical protein
MNSIRRKLIKWFSIFLTIILIGVFYVILTSTKGFSGIYLYQYFIILFVTIILILIINSFISSKAIITLKLTKSEQEGIIDTKGHQFKELYLTVAYTINSFDLKRHDFIHSLKVLRDGVEVKNLDTEVSNFSKYVGVVNRTDGSRTFNTYVRDSQVMSILDPAPGVYTFISNSSSASDRINIDVIAQMYD